MEQFNPNATRLIISFDNGEDEDWEIDEIPGANLESETIRDSENSTEVINETEKYRAVLYVNISEGNIEIFDNETDEEITEFQVEEIIEEEKIKGIIDDDVE